MTSREHEKAPKESEKHEAHSSHSTHHSTTQHKAHHSTHSKPEELPLPTINLVLMAAVLLISAISLYFLLTTTATMEQKLAPLQEQLKKAEEAAKPAILQMTLITADCAECFDISTYSSAVLALQDSNDAKITQTTLNAGSPEAQELIAKYKITKLPVFIVTGETERKASVSQTLQAFAQLNAEDKAYVFTAHVPVYYDVALARPVGAVTAVVLKDASCEKCWNVDQFVEGLKASMKLESSTLDAKSAEGRDLIAKYSLEKAPSVILSGDVFAYPQVVQFWPQFGTTTESGEYVLTKPQPPYVELSTGKVAGLVKMIRLTDANCTECYNVGLHDQIVKQAFGVAVVEDENVDVSSNAGKLLVARYEITKVPTILISPDASAYERLTQVWTGGANPANAVGIVAKDGWYVFTSTQLMGAYKNLSTGEVVKPQQQ